MSNINLLITRAFRTALINMYACNMHMWEQHKVYKQGSVDKDYPYLLRVSLEHYHKTAIKVLIYVYKQFYNFYRVGARR
jgi:hypothetical protein